MSATELRRLRRRVVAGSRRCQQRTVRARPWPKRPAHERRPRDPERHGLRRHRRRRRSRPTSRSRTAASRRSAASTPPTRPRSTPPASPSRPGSSTSTATPTTRCSSTRARASAIHQGVTLEVVGNCGFGCFPIVDPDLARKAIYGYSDDGAARVEHGRRLLRPARARAAGGQRAQPRPERPAAARDRRPRRPRRRHRRARHACRSCCASRSARARGATRPGSSTRRSRARPRRRSPRSARALDGQLYATHTRKRDEGQFESVEEAIRTAERAEARLQVSHLVPRNGIEESRRSIELVERARDRGLDVEFDMHTRRFGITHLYAALPPWALGADDLAALLTRPRRARPHAPAPRASSARANDWSRIVLFDNPFWPEYARRDLAEIAAERGQEPLDAVYDLLVPAVEEPHKLMVIIHAYDEQEQREAFAHPCCVPGLRRDDARARRPARRVVLPRRVHVGVVVLALHGQRGAAALARRGRAQADRPAGRAARPVRPRRAARRARAPTSPSSTRPRSPSAARPSSRTSSRRASRTCSSTACTRCATAARPATRRRDGAAADDRRYDRRVAVGGMKALVWHGTRERRVRGRARAGARGRRGRARRRARRDLRVRPARLPRASRAARAAARARARGRRAGRRRRDYAVYPLIGCGECEHCLAGEDNHCASWRLIGMHRPGVFAERVAVPRSSLVPLPDGIDHERAVLVEPLACCVGALAPHGDAQLVAVLGCGPLGLLTVYLARARGRARDGRRSAGRAARDRRAARRGRRPRPSSSRATSTSSSTPPASSRRGARRSPASAPAARS